MAAYEDESSTGTITVVDASPAFPDVVGSSVSLDLDGGQASFRIVVSGVFTPATSTVVFEQTTDNINWFPLSATPPGSGTGQTTTAATGATQTYFGCASGLNRIRARCSAITVNDAIIVTIRASMAPYVVGA